MLMLEPGTLAGLLDPALIRVLQDLDYTIGPSYVTSLHRPGDEGVHGTFPVRGIDIRARSSSVAAGLATYINRLWTYDPTRPDKLVAMAHNVGSGMHLHLQVHSRSRRQRTRDLP